MWRSVVPTQSDSIPAARMLNAFLSRPKPTITCNRKPKPWESYPLLFRETGCGREHFTTRMKKALAASRVVPFRNLYKLKEWENLMAPSGWDRVKKEAKERKVLFEHYSPPWRMVRKHSTAQASFGEKSRQVKAVTNLPEFDQETKMIRRCLALCEVKHCLGDFFALDFTYPPLAPSRRNTRACSPIRESCGSRPMRNKSGDQMCSATSLSPTFPGWSSSRGTARSQRPSLRSRGIG